jgi:hypothetical protein
MLGGFRMGVPERRAIIFDIKRWGERTLVFVYHEVRMWVRGGCLVFDVWARGSRNLRFFHGEIVMPKSCDCEECLLEGTITRPTRRISVLL